MEEQNKNGKLSNSQIQNKNKKQCLKFREEYLLCMLKTKDKFDICEEFFSNMIWCTVPIDIEKSNMNID